MLEDKSDHWSNTKNKTTLVWFIHASVLIPLMCFFFIKMSFWWVILWVAVDAIATFSKLTLLALLRRLRLKVGVFFHKGYRVRKDRYTINKIKRGKI